MPRKALITFNETNRPIWDRVTKFGGQPVWIDKPQWPLHAHTGEPLMFVCQIWMTHDLFPNCKTNMAYLFVADQHDSTWDPSEGASAVILQSLYGGMWYKGPRVETVELESGPSIYRIVDGEQQPCEFSVRLEPGDDLPYECENGDEDDWESQKLPPDWESLADEIKIGGTPYFIQEPIEFQHLILQFRGADLPFHLDVCWGWVLMYENEADFYWQAD